MSDLKPPRSERVGSIIFCDKLPYPTDYVAQNLMAIVFVPNDPEYIARAREAIGHMIAHGRLNDNLVRLRAVQNEEEAYDFDALIRGVLDEVEKAKNPLAAEKKIIMP